jgi:uncharacterized membrane protein
MKDFLQPDNSAVQHGEPDIQPDRSEVRFINKIVTIILAAGMYATLGFYLIGLILLFAKGDPKPKISLQYFHSFGAFLSGIFSLNPGAFLYLGTISLILTPISRVLISIFAFWREKDKKFVFVTMVVFIFVVASVVVGMVFKINVG